MHGFVLVLKTDLTGMLAVACHWTLLFVKVRAVQSRLHRIVEAKQQGCPTCFYCLSEIRVPRADSQLLATDILSPDRY